MKIRIVESKLPQSTRKQLMREFMKFCINELQLKHPIGCKIKLTSNKSKTQTYGHYNPGTKEIVVYMGERSLGDSMRTLVHELTHHKQNLEGRLKENSGKDGSMEENEANSTAGIVMRKFGKLHPEILE